MGAGTRYARVCNYVTRFTRPKTVSLFGGTKHFPSGHRPESEGVDSVNAAGHILHPLLDVLPTLLKMGDEYPSLFRACYFPLARREHER